MLTRDAKLKWLSIAAGLLASCCLAVSLNAGETVTCQSPNEKFALRETFTELNPIHGDTAIIETGARKVAVQLHGDEPAGSEKLVWSKDSRRVASFRYDWRSGATRIFSGTDRCSTRSKCRSFRHLRCQTFQNQTRQTAKR